MDLDARIAALITKAKWATADRPHGQALGCTEWQAAWCPNHGDCRGCQRENSLSWSADCPLHRDEWWAPNRFPDPDLTKAPGRIDGQLTMLRFYDAAGTPVADIDGTLITKFSIKLHVDTDRFAEIENVFEQIENVT